MNKIRRALIEVEIERLRTGNDLDDILNCIGEYLDEEEDYYDRLGNLQMSKRGYKAEDAIDNLADAYDLLEMAIENGSHNFEPIIAKLEKAKG